MPYQSRLQALDLQSLVYRRYRGDMIGVYKFFRGIYTSRHSLLSTAPKSAVRDHGYRLSTAPKSAVRDHGYKLYTVCAVFHRPRQRASYCSRSCPSQTWSWAGSIHRLGWVRLGWVSATLKFVSRIGVLRYLWFILLNDYSFIHLLNTHTMCSTRVQIYTVNT